MEESQRELKQQQVRGSQGSLLGYACYKGHALQAGCSAVTRSMPCRVVSVSKRLVSCAESLLLLALLPAQAVEQVDLMVQYREHNQEWQAFQD